MMLLWQDTQPGSKGPKENIPLKWDVDVIEQEIELDWIEQEIELNWTELRSDKSDQSGFNILAVLLQ